jgi:hypothetical protein
MESREVKRGDAVIWRSSDWWHAGFVERTGGKGNYAVRTTKGKVEEVSPQSLQLPNPRQRELFFPEERPLQAKSVWGARKVRRAISS